MKLIRFLPVTGNPFKTELSVNAEPALFDEIQEAFKNAKIIIEKHNRRKEIAGFIPLMESYKRLISNSMRLAGVSVGSLLDSESATARYGSFILEIDLYCGRRALVDASQKRSELWRDVRMKNPQVRLHTYDGLVDAFREIEGR